MKLRTKAILFFGLFLLIVILAVVFYAQYVVGDTFNTQTTKMLRVQTESTEGAYFTFLESMKREALDWTAGPSLQHIVEGLLRTENGTPARAKSARDFETYITGKKMPFDKSILMADVLDKKGIVIASTRPARIGTDELSEEIRLKAHNFSKTIVSKFGETFVNSIIFEQDETPEPIIHATVRFFAQEESGAWKPLDAVLLVHFLNAQKIADVFAGKSQEQYGAHVGKGFLVSYNTSDVYLVDSDRIMVTPSRYVEDTKQQQKVNTFPVSECLEKGNEVDAEYVNYRGVLVMGSSACLVDEGLVLVVEISKDEIFAPLAVLSRTTILAGEVFLIFGVFIIIFFIRLPLSRLDVVISALRRVMNGDLAAQAIVDTNDEIGLLAKMFNTMVGSIRNSQKELEESKRVIEDKALILEKDVEEHKKQEKFLEDSKLATLNLLEDSWKAKEKLEEEGTKLQTIIASIGDGLIIIDPNYKIMLVNKKALEIFAMTREELLDNDLREVAKLCKKKVFLKTEEWPTEEVFLSQKPFVTTLEDSYCITTKGRDLQLPVAFSVAPIGGGFPGLVIVVRDITEDRELDEAKSGFISVASHQLRTPLTSIRWYSEMLLSEDAGALNDSQRDFMNEIHGGAERLYQTVDLLLGISRVESGKLKADRTPIDLSAFTAEIAKELAPQINIKEIGLTVSPPDREPIIVWLDSLTLRQVILNLLSNSIRYTNMKGAIEVKWWVSDDGREVVYMVRDDGIGVPEAQHSRIFSKFFRAENARAQVPDGSGLGLALVKDLIESWGGRVWFESSEGNGTTFFFTIPFTTTPIFQ